MLKDDMLTQATCRVFRKAGSIDPAVYSHKDSLQLGPAIKPRNRLPFKLHYSNKGYQMLLKQGWEEGKGLGFGAKGRADPYIPTHQCGRDARLGLGCMRYKDILTGKGAEDEIRVCASAAHPVNLSIFVLSVSKHVCLYMAVPVCACKASFYLSIISCISL